ncbi:hypothetical protein OE88DRAFT_400829 [Heliocybe sulcata]|uniref:SET domain-containing protein n=1 Tax=Heliocybe sulcata TaxID=5364 RepID=A0A5C3MWK7_9AGAM|nr:hypothetical protein OE88DRAFT_400829 [Heliocybe sulcata]
MNYQFDLDSAASGSYYLAGGDPDQRENFFLDSMRAGNCTMYINHAPEKQANVHAECRSVNSESRIAIFASKTIPIGKELFLYYGEKYFGDKDGDSDGEGDHRSSAHISVLE